MTVAGAAGRVHADRPPSAVSAGPAGSPPNTTAGPTAASPRPPGPRLWTPGCRRHRRAARAQELALLRVTSPAIDVGARAPARRAFQRGPAPRGAGRRRRWSTAELAGVADRPPAPRRLGRGPGPGEGPPAALGARRPGLRGVKTFCSGAGGPAAGLRPRPRPGDVGAGAPGLRRPDRPGDPVDRAWFAARACGPARPTASSSTARPCSGFARSPARCSRSRGSPATRSAPPSAGPAGPTPRSTRRVAILRAKGAGGDLEALAAGRAADRAADDRPVARARPAGARRAARRAAPGGSPPAAPRRRGGRAPILDEAARACGSRPFATGSAARPRPARPRDLPPAAPAGPDRRARRAGRARA